MMTPPLSYIRHASSDGDGSELLGFHRYNTPGYIDCGSGWDDEQREEFFETVLLPLEPYICTSECMEFTFEIHTPEGLTEKLKELGIEPMEALWEE